jgi:hypothetical protein
MTLPVRAEAEQPERLPPRLRQPRMVAVARPNACENGMVIVFICNRCPYVRAVVDRLVAAVRPLMAEAIGFAAICSSDASAYPEDLLAAMRRIARARAFPVPDTTLERLERKGFISSRRDEPIHERGGRARRNFRIERLGIETLKSAA